MKLQDARVDLDGGVIAIGTIVYPASNDNRFPLSTHDCVRLVRHADCLRIAPTTAVRDAESGFLIHSASDITIIVPEFLTSIIMTALGHLPLRPVNASLSVSSDGLQYLPSVPTVKRAHGFRTDRIWQPLSDWHLEMFPEPHETLNIRLYEPGPLRPFQATQVQHWKVADGETPPRIDITFLVDHSTRVAAFHAACIGKPADGIRNDAIPATSANVNTLKLSRAPIDVAGRIYGLMGNGDCASLQDIGDKTLVVRSSPVKTLGSHGLLFSDTRHLSPAICLKGLRVKDIVDMLGKQTIPSATLEYKDGDSFGYLVQDRGFHERDLPRPARQMIQRAIISCCLSEKGLELGYKIFVNDLDVSRNPFVPGWLQDTITLPWEIVVLRFSPLVRFRKAIRDPHKSQ